jgi:ubiquinone/menaquinone biosynthesis C-methylase UbiE
MPAFDHFTHLAPFYERALPFDALESLLRHGSFSTSHLVLDAGGGTGRVAVALKPYVRGVVVADISRGMLLQASRKRLPALLSPVEALPFSNDIFDRILIIDTFHHVRDQVATANELWRVLAPGGKILIQEPDIRKFAIRLVAAAEKIALMRSHFLSAPRIADLFRPHTPQLVVKDEGFSSWVIVRK